MFQYFYNSSINDCSVYRLWKAGRLWRWEGRFKDACLNEAYSEQEMLNVKGEKVDFSSDYLYLLQDYGFGFVVPENWRSEYEGLFRIDYPEQGKICVIIATEEIISVASPS